MANNSKTHLGTVLKYTSGFECPSCSSWCRGRAVLVCFLGHVAHFGPNVSQQEEADGGDATGNLGYPEGRFPAMVLGDGAERQTRQEAAN